MLMKLFSACSRPNRISGVIKEFSKKVLVILSVLMILTMSSSSSILFVPLSYRILIFLCLLQQHEGKQHPILIEHNKQHRVLRLSCKDKCCLLCSIKMGCCFPSCCWSKHKKIKILYDKGTNRIEDELDIVKIIKTLRMTKTFLENSFITPEIRFGLEHAENNFINIDLSEDD
jgi:hypothetical protein